MTFQFLQRVSGEINSFQSRTFATSDPQMIVNLDFSLLIFRFFPHTKKILELAKTFIPDDLQFACTHMEKKYICDTISLSEDESFDRALLSTDVYTFLTSYCNRRFRL
jgi:hypothetical protein